MKTYEEAIAACCVSDGLDELLDNARDDEEMLYLLSENDLCSALSFIYSVPGDQVECDMLAAWKASLEEMDRLEEENDNTL